MESSWNEYSSAQHIHDPFAWRLYKERYSAETLEGKKDALIAVLKTVEGLTCDGFQIDVSPDKAFNDVVGDREKALLQELSIVCKALEEGEKKSLEEEVVVTRVLVERISSPRQEEPLAILDFNLNLLKSKKVSEMKKLFVPINKALAEKNDSDFRAAAAKLLSKPELIEVASSRDLALLIRKSFPHDQWELDNIDTVCFAGCIQRSKFFDIHIFFKGGLTAIHIHSDKPLDLSIEERKILEGIAVAQYLCPEESRLVELELLAPYTKHDVITFPEEASIN